MTALTGGARAAAAGTSAPYAPSGLTDRQRWPDVVILECRQWRDQLQSLPRVAERWWEFHRARRHRPHRHNYTDTGLTSGLTYYYQVVGVNASRGVRFSHGSQSHASGQQPDPAQFNFETSPQGWSGNNGIISGYRSQPRSTMRELAHWP